MDVIQLVSAAGLGAIIATALQSYLTDKSAQKQRNFLEKKEAYVGFLNAIHRSEIEQTEEASLYAGHWVNVCDLVGSQDVRKALIDYKRTNPINGGVHPDRPDVMKRLKNAMRKDLGFSLD